MEVRPAVVAAETVEVVVASRGVVTVVSSFLGTRRTRQAAAVVLLMTRGIVADPSPHT